MLSVLIRRLAQMIFVMLGISILFNVMGVANRFILWRIDAARVRAEHEIGLCFGPATTLGDIAAAAGPSSRPNHSHGKVSCGLASIVLPHKNRSPLLSRNASTCRT